MCAFVQREKRRLIVLLVCSVLAAVFQPASGQVAAQDVAIVHVNLIDGTGAAVARDQTVVLSGGRISAIGEAARTPVPPKSRTIDGTGKYLIPGLWDLHVHTRYEGIDHLRLFVANGVTSVRDMGGPWEHFEQLKRWRQEIAKGERIGPRIVAAAQILDGPGSELDFSFIVNGPTDARAIVRRLKASGADFVKVYSVLGRDSFDAIVDEARLQGLPVAGHPPIAVGLRAMSDAGVLSVEHLPQVILASSAREEDILRRARNVELADVPKLRADSRGAAGFDPAKAVDVAALLQRNGTAVVPTLSNPWTMLASTRKESRIADRLRYVPPAYREAWAGPGNVNDTLFETSRQAARILHERGVALLAGTDAVKAQFLPGFSLHDELALLVSVGLSPGEALEAATRKPARLVGHTDVGTIERGMRGDLVLLTADPLQDIENTRRIDTVFLAGRVLNRTALDAMLAEIESEALQWKGTPTDRFQTVGKPQRPGER